LFRKTVVVRDATPDDAEALVRVWCPQATRPPSERDGPVSMAEGAARSALRCAADPDQRMLVALVDDRVVGAVHLYLAPLSPLHAEQAVHLSHLNVVDEARRQGAGHALIEAAVCWAEERTCGYLLAAAHANSREANRFLARLGLTQVAVVRGAATSVLRSKLPVEQPAVARADARHGRSVGTVLAQRRSLRRARDRIG
jgi:GNAT superfamily N-acetyltransferase